MPLPGLPFPALPPTPTARGWPIFKPNLPGSLHIPLPPPPIRSAAYGSPAYHTPSGTSSHPHYHQPTSPHSFHSASHETCPSLVDGFTHPRHLSYLGTDRSMDRSNKRYYVVYRGRHRGIFHSWPLAWALTAGYHWGPIRGHVGGFNDFPSAAQAYLQHAGDIDPYAPIPGCGPLAASIPFGRLGLDPALFYQALFSQPHVPFPHRPLPIPLSAPAFQVSRSSPIKDLSFHSTFASPSSSPIPPLPVQSSGLASVADSFTIVSSHAASVATKAYIQAALVASITSSDNKKELSMSLPRFNGDPTKFNEWFTMLTTRLSTPVWRHIHLASPDYPSYESLSQALYLVLIVVLHDQAADHWRSRNDILHNSIGLLAEVTKYYRVSQSYSLINLMTDQHGIISSRRIKRHPSNFHFAPVNLFQRQLMLANYSQNHSFVIVFSWLLVLPFMPLSNPTSYTRRTSPP